MLCRELLVQSNELPVLSRELPVQSNELPVLSRELLVQKGRGSLRSALGQ